MAQAKLKTKSSNPESKFVFSSQMNHRLREAGMLLSFAFAGFFLIALFSYDAEDPSWSRSGSNVDIGNFSGIAGANLSMGRKCRTRLCRKNGSCDYGYFIVFDFDEFISRVFAETL